MLSGEDADSGNYIRHYAADEAERKAKLMAAKENKSDAGGTGKGVTESGVSGAKSDSKEDPLQAAVI